MRKYLLISSACAAWLISVSAIAGCNDANQAEKVDLASPQITAAAVAAEPDKRDPKAAAANATAASAQGSKQNAAPYQTPLRDYNNNGVFGD